MLVEINQQSNYYNDMNYSFEYIDIILLAMIAGFIFLRLRGILGKRTGFEGKSPAQFNEVLKKIKVDQPAEFSIGAGLLQFGVNAQLLTEGAEQPNQVTHLSALQEQLNLLLPKVCELADVICSIYS